MRTLLSVDWDFFFPRLFEAYDGYAEARPERGPALLYDWGHNESLLNIGPFMWNIRAGSFLQHGFHLPQTTGEEDTFWEMFEGRIAPDAPVVVAESHSHILRVIDGGYHMMGDYTDIYNYDAHHDLGYGSKSVLEYMNQMEWDCGNWGVYATLLGIHVHTRFPQWASETIPNNSFSRLDFDFASEDNLPERVDGIFICRSGAWSPSWIDHEFIAFVESCPSFNDRLAAKALCSVHREEGWPDLMTPRSVDPQAFEVSPTIKGE